MSSTTQSDIPIRALTGSLRDYRDIHGTDILTRVDGFFDWQDLRRQYDLWSYSKSAESAPKPVTSAKDDSGGTVSGVNFGSQDYLGLSSHEAIKDAAKAAIDEFGVHSAGSAALLGNTRYSLQLERVIADFCRRGEVVLYPTGWSAGFGAVQGLVRANDHVLMDILTHSCLQEGALAATRNIHFHGHLNVEGARRKLRKIRANDARNGILVVTESLFSMHADTPDLAALQEVCREYEATLLVDAAHDLGCIGETGHGYVGLQEMLDDVDILIGSFSKTFASNGGFVTANTRAMKEYLKYYSATQTFSNAMSPAQAAVVLKAFEIVQSDEGRALRHSLMDNILYLRGRLEQAGLDVTGAPSAVVPVNIGSEGQARLAARRLGELGAIANLVEYPAVPKGNARFRLQVMANHTSEEIDRMVALLAHAVDEAKTAFEPYRAMMNAPSPASRASAAVA